MDNDESINEELTQSNISFETVLLHPDDKRYGGMYPPHMHVWDSSYKKLTGHGTAEIIITDSPPTRPTEILYKRGALDSRDAKILIGWAHFPNTEDKTCKINWDYVKTIWIKFYKEIYLPNHKERKDKLPIFPQLPKINMWGSRE